MRWNEFRRWAWDSYRYPIRGGSTHRDPSWRPILGNARGAIRGYTLNPSTGTGSGNYAQYTPVHQRRFAMWLRARELIDNLVIMDWLAAGEDRDSGWLVNDGSGIRWVDDPELEVLDLVRSGFVAVKCGL